MLYLHCPHCQETRSEPEFSNAGEAGIARPAEPEQSDDRSWAQYLFFRANPKGDHLEQWVHSHGCRKYFVVRRNTVSNAITGSYTLLEAKKLMDTKAAVKTTTAIKKVTKKAKTSVKRRTSATTREPVQ